MDGALVEAVAPLLARRAARRPPTVRVREAATSACLIPFEATVRRRPSVGAAAGAGPLTAAHVSAIVPPGFGAPPIDRMGGGVDGPYFAILTRPRAAPGGTGPHHRGGTRWRDDRSTRSGPR